MLTRRKFTGVAGCAVCGLAEFVATGASAQTTTPATTPGVTRKILSQVDGPAPGYVTLSVEAEIEAGVPVGRHMHPGSEVRLYPRRRFRASHRRSRDPQFEAGATNARCPPQRPMPAANLALRKQGF